MRHTWRAYAGCIRGMVLALMRNMFARRRARFPWSCSGQGRGEHQRRRFAVGKRSYRHDLAGLRRLITPAEHRR